MYSPLHLLLFSGSSLEYCRHIISIYEYKSVFETEAIQLSVFFNGGTKWIIASFTTFYQF